MQKTIDAGPQVKVTKLSEGDLLELRIPKVGPIDTFASHQECYVWRDRVTNTASLACPSPASIDFGNASGGD